MATFIRAVSHLQGRIRLVLGSHRNDANPYLEVPCKGE